MPSPCSNSVGQGVDLLPAGGLGGPWEPGEQRWKITGLEEEVEMLRA